MHEYHIEGCSIFIECFNINILYVFFPAVSSDKSTTRLIVFGVGDEKRV